MEYQEKNAEIIDGWVREDGMWGDVTSHEAFLRAKDGDWEVMLTPEKTVPRDWFPDLAGKDVLGLASGGGEQMPIFAACGARCAVLDYSEAQLGREREVAAREGYKIDLVRADMSKPLPFADASFDLIFHPVSNHFVEDVLSVWRECSRVLRPGGVLLAGFENGLNLAFDEEETRPVYRLPFNPLKDPALYEDSIQNGWGIEFSHTVEELIGGQLRAGFALTDIYSATNDSGNFRDYNISTFYATRAVKR